MKVIAFNGSARKGGNTEQLIRMVFKELELEGVETELVHIGGKPVRSCIACMKCWENLNEECNFKDDETNSYIQKVKEANGIILASPTYFANVSAELKAFIDRVGMVARANNDLFKRKIGAAVVAVRRAGSIHVFNSINHFFLIGQMIVVGSSYWNNGIGLLPGDVNNDEEGIQIMQNLGKNMVWLMEKAAKE